MVFTITVTCNGPNDATGIKVSDQLPLGLTCTGSDPSQGSYDSGTGSWDVGDLVSGSSANLTITAQTEAGGELTNMASRTASSPVDLTSANDTASVSIRVNRGPEIVQESPLQVEMDEDGSPVGWLVPTLTATDADGDPLKWSLLNGPSHGEAAVNGEGPAPTTFTYKPEDDFFGNDSFVAQVSDGNGVTDAITVNVTVNAVNDAPIFSKGSDQMVLEDAGVQSIVDWATDISCGPANESIQSLSFIVTPHRPELFSNGPAIDTAGRLIYTCAPDANGEATITVMLKDGGGTDRGGNDTSETETFRITIIAVNDPPVFTKGADLIVSADGSERAVKRWAQDISSGPDDEGGQGLMFSVTPDQPELFLEEPIIDSSGTLTFAPAPDVNGTAIVWVVLEDDGGIENGGADTSEIQAFSITVRGHLADISIQKTVDNPEAAVLEKM